MKLLRQLHAIVLESEKKETFTDKDEWMAAVKRTYPDKADKIQFKGTVEDGKHLFYAQIPGEDRCYGVFNMDDDEGEVLHEGFFSKKKQTPKSAWDCLEIIAKEGKGEFGFGTLEMDDAMKLVDFKKADALAKKLNLRKESFWANSEEDMRYLVNKHPEVLLGKAAELFKTIKPVTEGAVKDAMIDLIERAAKMVGGEEEDPKTVELIAKKVLELDSNNIFGGNKAEILGMIKTTLG